MKFGYLLWICAALALGEDLTVSLRTEPRTLNPIFALDNSTRDVMRLLHADLVRINRETLATEAMLAESWKVSSDGRTIDVKLRAGLRFSDGVPCTVDDVLFTFGLYLDEKLASPQRDLLVVGGQPVAVSRTGERMLRFRFAAPYGPAERLFDSLFILPKHRLEAAYRAGKLKETWNLTGKLGEIAGMGPYVAAEYRPGERLRLARNPHFVRRSEAKSNLHVRFLADANSEALQFRAGSLDLLSRVPASTFEALREELEGKGYRFTDAGPSLEYHFLFFNLNDSGLSEELRGKQTWFRQRAFRQAVSLALDREGIRKLAYGGRASALWQPVSPGNRLWFAADLPRPARSLEKAKDLLRGAGFRWNGTGELQAANGETVAFTLVVNGANVQQAKAATLIREDLRQLGMRVQVVPLEFRSLVNRVLEKKDYEAAIMALAAGDADPGPEMPVWLSSGKSHFWNLNPTRLEPWEEEMDRAMQAQMMTAKRQERYQQFRRVQALAAEHLPVICFASPHVLSAARPGVGPLRPAILPPYAWFGIEEIRGGQRP